MNARVLYRCTTISIARRRELAGPLTEIVAGPHSGMPDRNECESQTAVGTQAASLRVRIPSRSRPRVSLSAKLSNTQAGSRRSALVADTLPHVFRLSHFQAAG